MRIAIVGAGVSGLVTAHLLDSSHEVTVFEAADYAGGHANTVRVDTAHETHHVDTGFIVFNDRNYLHFERLLARLEVASQPSPMSFGVSDGRGDFEYTGASANGLFAKRAHLVTPWFHRMVADMARFNRAARELLRDGTADGGGPSLGQWLEQQRFSRPFIDRLIVPQASAVWSADPRQMWTFPARFLAEFFDNHGMLSFRDRPRWRTVSGGSARYVDALLARFRGRVRLGTPVSAVRRSEQGVLVTPHGGEPDLFDEVVLATHSDQALALLADASDGERQLLSAIPYQANEAVLHTDTSILPRRRRAWASWNYHLSDAPAGRTAVTYHMNRLQALRAEREFCVTLNRTGDIDPAHVIRRIDYAHPVYTREGVAAQRRLADINGRNHTHFCGAYWGWGFHEDGVVSALRVAERFGARL
ncbi:MAG TPA: FAD-dependent oxidoreductase [Solirubrobacteraceae bacterium]|jgi:predicted NAD/FAD-binding protein|nr:FAD-dependent oxidoreductase [Solirubrobacteraceae bacterium]